MRYEMLSFRNAELILRHSTAWAELQSEIEAISGREILSIHAELETARKKAPAGAQSAINEAFRRRLKVQGWKPEPRLFKDPGLKRWKMDFHKVGVEPAQIAVGVEVSFNHAEAIAWTLTRLDIAAESPEVIDSSRVTVGVAMFATEDLKQWGRMDGAVGTFELAQSWLKAMAPILPVPILLVGLSSDGFPPEPPFRGTSSSR